MKTKIVLATLAALAATMITACETSSGGGAYLQPWYDVYGTHCGSGTPRPGCNFYSDGTRITAGRDPFAGGAFLDYQTYQYTDSYGYTQFYTGYGWVSPSGILYDEAGYALNNTNEQGSRDLLGDVAEAESNLVSKIGQEFAQKFALSESTGVHIARTLNDWATLSKKEQRARTANDAEAFAKRLYGVSLEKALDALKTAKNGDSTGVASLNNEVASYWGTSPETSSAILKSWYKNQLNDLGVQ